MRVIFTCGGTAGHVNPALALAGLIRDRRPTSEILFVGAHRGIERKLIEAAGWKFRAVEISSFHRSLRPSEIRHNMVSLRNLIRSPKEARGLLEIFPADLVVGTGGYASYPVVKAAARRHIPTAIHESNALPGMTTKALAGLVDVVMVGFEAAKPYYGRAKRVEVTGTPVRPDFYRYTRTEARQALGFPRDGPVVLCFWGSLGAARMNEYMEDFIALAVKNGVPFRLIQGAGRNFSLMREHLREKGIDLSRYPQLELREYIYDMPAVMAASDLVLCRSGAATLSEVAAVSKPAILVPSPNVTADHQTKNARVLSDSGGAVLLPEEECSGEALYRLVEQLLSDGLRRKNMARALSALSSSDAAEEIYRVLRSVM